MLVLTKSFIYSPLGITTIVISSLLLIFILSIIFYRCFFKRFYDLLFSFIGIILLSPLYLILIILGFINMKGNPFFIQLRPGKKDKFGQEKIFKLIKFRSMNNKKDKDGNLLPDKDRLSKYGKFIRNTSLDELPELFNIFIGNMSFVGPRPLLIKDLVFMSKEERNRHNIKPGLSGLAQVKGRNAISWEDKLSYDLTYIKKISLFKDMKIILLTFVEIFKKNDVNRNGTASDIDLGDYLLMNNKISKSIYEEKINEAKSYLSNIDEDELLKEWKYYNHSIISSLPPHIEPNIKLIQNKTIWKHFKKAYLATWCSDFNSKDNTEWWYVIKDTPFDMNLVNKKIRYTIRRGLMHFDFIEANPLDYIDELYEINKACQLTYPKYNQNIPSLVDFTNFIKNIVLDNNRRVILAIDKENNIVAGYMILTIHTNSIDFNILKVHPKFEKYNINEAFNYYLLDKYKDRFDGSFYILDGARSISHTTNFQDYLIRKFIYKKVYAKLHVSIRPSIKPLVYLLYPFRNIFKKCKRLSLLHNIYGVLHLLELSRKCK